MTTGILDQQVLQLLILVGVSVLVMLAGTYVLYRAGRDRGEGHLLALWAGLIAFLLGLGLFIIAAWTVKVYARDIFNL